VAGVSPVLGLRKDCCSYDRVFPQTRGDEQAIDVEHDNHEECPSQQACLGMTLVEPRELFHGVVEPCLDPRLDRLQLVSATPAAQRLSATSCFMGASWAPDLSEVGFQSFEPLLNGE
jgi:hypothetical protein